MKKIFLLTLLAGFILSGISYSSVNKDVQSSIAGDEWEKAPNGAWAGKDGVWYKLDDKANVWWSKDGKKWEAVKGGMWQDKDGKWLKIGDKKLWWSADERKSWSEVPEWKWQGSDGKWYKFDKNWGVWVTKK